MGRPCPPCPPDYVTGIITSNSFFFTFHHVVDSCAQWGRPFGRAPREICPAILTHPRWEGYCTTTMRWQDASSEDTLYKTSIISSSTVLSLNPFVNLSLAPISLFLTYGPDLGVWPDFGISAEFLRAPIPRKGSGSTTTTITLAHSLNWPSNAYKR